VRRLEDVDPVQLCAVQEALLDPSLILRAKRRPEGVVVDFVCEEANEAACEELEVPRADLIGARLTETLTGALGAFLFDQCVEAVDSGEPLSFADMRTPGPTGAIAHYDIRAVAVGDRVCFSWREVSDRIRTQEALAESRNRFRLLAENASDVVVLVGPEGVVEWVSPSVRDMLGWEPEDLVGRRGADFVHPDDHRRRTAVHRHPATVRTLSDEVRFRRAGGDYLWTSLRIQEVRDDSGRLADLVVSVRDIHKQVRARAALVASEERYRLLAENVSDIVYQVCDGRIVWISPSVERVLGWKAADVVGRPSFDLIAPEDLDRAGVARATVVADVPLEHFECRFLTASGGRRWMRVHARRIDAAGGAYGLVAGLHDIHEGHAGRMAIAALAAVNAVLVAADDDETRLLDEVCRLVVEHGGFDGAHWRPGPNPSTGPPDGSVAVDLAVSVDGRIDRRLIIESREPDAFGPSVVSTLEQLAHQVGMALSAIRTRERLVEALNEQELLSTAIEQADESVMVTDLDARILYANPATAASSGYPLGEIVGASPRLFASGLHGPDFFREINGALRAGTTWRGIVVNRTKQGELYEEDTTITPVRSDDGEITSFVSVRRNISRERRLEADLDRLRNDRDSVVRAMGEVRAGATLEVTASSFCQAVTRLADLDIARVLLVESDDEVVPLGITGPGYLDWEVGVPVAFDFLPLMLERTRNGPWWVPLTELLAGEGGRSTLIRPMLDAGFASVGFAPVSRAGRLVAVLVVASRTPVDGRSGEARTTVLEELSSFAGQILGDQASHRGEWRHRRGLIRAVIDGARFRPVFQPVVDLATGEVVGYEALTRFADGRRPDVVFEDAHDVGLGVGLETACASAAVLGARGLPAGTWLAVNLSPASVISGAVGAMAEAADRPLVIEITEHVEVESYAAVRTAIRGCPEVRLSVDDAGAGYASLRHILELRPDFVKLDIGLVRHIDSDPARQALAAGLRHYAQQTRTVLIAEGVETPAERDVLQRLGIPLAQGYLCGHPEPVPPGDGSHATGPVADT